MTVGLVLAFIGLLVFGLVSKATNDSIDQSLADGHPAPAPAFDLPILSLGDLQRPLANRLRPAVADGRLTLSELRGTPVVLNFWASWCAPCREEAPILEAGWKRFEDQGVLFLGLDMQDLTGDARRFLDEFDVSYPTIRDQGSDTSRDYGATGIPETYFINGAGRVVSHVIGVVRAEQLNQGVSSARSGQVVGTEQGGARRAQR